MKKAFRKLKHWLSQSIAYSIFIWKNDNYDWDYVFFLKLLRFKLDRMAKTIKDNEIIEANIRVAKQINYVSYLISRYLDDTDLEKENAKFELKWGKTTHITRDRGYSIGFEKATTEEQRKLATQDFVDMYKRVDAKEKELLDRAFKHIAKYLQRWWD